MKRERQGEIMVLIGAFFWGLFPIITILSFGHISALSSLAWSTVCAAVCFSIILSFRKKWKEVTNLSALKDIIGVALVSGVLFYALFFSGLTHTSAGNGSIIALTEIFFSFLFFHVWHKDYISKEHIVGAGLMLLGGIIVLYPNATGFRIGDILILMAACIAPIGNFFQQKARKKVSSETILFMRNLIAAPFLFALAYVFHQTATISELKQSIFFILINGFFLLGCLKILWVEGIHRIDVTKASALSSINPLVTLLFAWILLKDIPTVWQLLSLIPMIFGVILLGKNKDKTGETLETTP